MPVYLRPELLRTAPVHQTPQLALVHPLEVTAGDQPVQHLLRWVLGISKPISAQLVGRSKGLSNEDKIL